MGSDGKGDQKKRQSREWGFLPDLLLWKIAKKMTGVGRDFRLFGSICSRWRMVWKHVLPQFLSSQIPQTLLLLSGSGAESSAATLKVGGLLHFGFYFYSILDGGLYRIPQLPAAAVEGLRVLGYSRGHLIAIDVATESILSILNPLNGVRFDLPALEVDDRSFDYALLTEPPYIPEGAKAAKINRDCWMVLVKMRCTSDGMDEKGRFLLCRLIIPEWSVVVHDGPIRDAISIARRLVFHIGDKVLMVRLKDPSTIIRIKPGCNRKSLCGSGLLALVFHPFAKYYFPVHLRLNEKGKLYTMACAVPLFRTPPLIDEERLAYLAWPTSACLSITWQRSDLFCTIDDILAARDPPPNINSFPQALRKKRRVGFLSNSAVLRSVVETQHPFFIDDLWPSPFWFPQGIPLWSYESGIPPEGHERVDSNVLQN